MEEQHGEQRLGVLFKEKCSTNLTQRAREREPSRAVRTL